MNKIEIIPAVLSQSWKELEENIGRVQGVAKVVQIDVVDGVYAPHKTWPYRDGKHFKEIVEQEHGLPLWEELDFEFDLMVEDPAGVVMDYVHAGASRVVLHAKSKTALKALEQLVSLRVEGGAFAVAVGMALGASQSPDDLEPFESQFDYVQVMGIEHEGRQGEPFAEKARYLVERLKHRYPNLPVQVDGGVTPDTIKALVVAGASRLVAGSAIFKTDDPHAAYQALTKAANS